MVYEIDEIRNIRKKLDMTQFDLAKRSGVSQSMIAKIEAGRLDPSYTNAKKIFMALEDLEKKEELKAKDIMNKKIISIKSNEKIKAAIQTMKKFQISQMPVIDNNKLVGFISESIMLECLTEKECEKVKDTMAEPPPIVSKESSSEVISSLLKHFPMVLVSEEGDLIGLITKADLLSKLYR